MGPRFPLVASAAFDLALGVAYMQELEKLDRAAEPDSGEQQLAHRLSTYAALALRVNERLRFGQTAYAQPRINRPKDVRVLSESELLVSISDMLALKATFSLGYDSFPPDGRHTLDTVTKTGLQLKLR
jgi:putative salt-induced outer membrane protein YdiY